jgi:hypothetical protein
VDATDSTTDTNISLLEDENNDVDEGGYLSSSIHKSLTEVEDHTDTSSNFHKGISPLPQHELHLSESNKYCNVQMFDIIAGSTSITIYGIDLYINMATVQDIGYTYPIEIYTKLGSYEGSEENRNNWTLIRSSSDVAVVNSGGKIYSEFQNLITIAPGDKRAFYIACAANNKCLQHYHGTQTLQHSQDHLMYGEKGEGKQSYLWDDPISSSPTQFEGALRYYTSNRSDVKENKRRGALENQKMNVSRRIQEMTVRKEKSNLIMQNILTWNLSNLILITCIISLFLSPYLISHIFWHHFNF